MYELLDYMIHMVEVFTRLRHPQIQTRLEANAHQRKFSPEEPQGDVGRYNTWLGGFRMTPIGECYDLPKKMGHSYQLKPMITYYFFAVWGHALPSRWTLESKGEHLRRGHNIIKGFNMCCYYYYNKTLSGICTCARHLFCFAGVSQSRKHRSLGSQRLQLQVIATWGHSNKTCLFWTTCFFYRRWWNMMKLSTIHPKNLGFGHIQKSTNARRLERFKYGIYTVYILEWYTPC